MGRHLEEPQWVLVNEALRNVSEFAGLIPMRRPKAYCPVCGQAAILKLGKKRVHHYAHEPNIKCGSSNPETALHLNTKFHIFTELRKGRQLIIEKPCSGFCHKTKEFVWAEHWKDVRVEHSIDPIRPDITLIGDDSTIGAIEVFVSHAVDEKKAQEFKKQGLRWIEIKASDSIYRGDNAWRIEQPLPRLLVKSDSIAIDWKCETCTAYERRNAKLQVQAIGAEDKTRREYSNEAVCMFCKEKTTDWWYINPVLGECKCRSCYRQGKY